MGSITPNQTAHEARLLSRQNLITNTSGYAPGYLQANLLILPSKHANDFHNLCLRNPVPCPILGITPPGDPHTILPSGCIQTPDFDIRTDFPTYRIYKHGQYLKSCRDLNTVWTEETDYVGFLIGCSYSFEDALTAAGLQPRHQKTNTIVAMYRSNIPLLPAGIFTGGKCIVSMRPYKLSDIPRVRAITAPFLATHGEPVAWGWDGAKELGIEDVSKPDFGEPQVFEDGEVPVFWACGVTPQMAVEAAGERIEGLVFSHEPGHMLCCDWTTEDLGRLKEKM